MDLLDIIFPKRCPICDIARNVDETGICPDCKKKVKYVNDPVCKKCGRPMEHEAGLCEWCQKDQIKFDYGRSLFAYSSVIDSVYKFKYMNRAPYAKQYAKLLVEHFREILDKEKVDALIPVPIHKKRLMHRGYNQATELALEISSLTDIPVKEHVIIRKKNTKALKYLGKKERRNSMKKAFIVRENVVDLRRVVIIDDIFTTGSTINSMAEELKAEGVKEVLFLTLCRAGI